MAPATPAPSAVPRMSLSCSDEDALPCSLPATPRRTTSVTAEYMNPMPIPGMAQVRIVISGGAPATTTGRVSRPPIAMQAKPRATKRRGP